MKFCTNCGLQVAPDVSSCPRCGAFIASPQFSSLDEQSNVASHGYGTPSATEEIVASPQQPVILPPPPPSPQYPSGSAYSSPTSTTAFMPPASPTSPYVPPSALPLRRSGMSRSMVILSALLACLVLLAGLGLIYYAVVARPAQLHAQATATVQAIQTSNANATTVANTQATGTAVAYANATVTAQTQVTAQAQATVQALQTIYTQATQGTAVRSSSLAGQDSNDWDQYQTTDGGGCVFMGGALHATLFSSHFYVPCFAQNSQYNNFAFQTQMTINKGDEGGLVFRADDQNAKFYLFSVGHDGTYALYLSKDDKSNMSIAYGNSSAIKTAYGQSNLLTVVAHGSNIYLYVNKQFVSTVNDPTYSIGKIGVFAGDNTNDTDVSFTNAQVWKL